ncbi:MAG: DUF763 domain-containing protein [Saprospiraceae bacterium]|nr:DUF763 domain-containing protein [Saprospiraceae bacterium]
MRRSGYTDLPLHGGKVPPWLYERMGKLGRAIIEMILVEHGAAEVIRRLSDPFWFQSFGAVLGMDWHSSGITTSVMGALKKTMNPIAHRTSLHFCGGRGAASRRTPEELRILANRQGLDGHELIRSSRLTAKIDNTAVQDGFQIYLHSFVITDAGDWTVIQQGMNERTGTARRYHWHSPDIKSFVSDPHASIYGEPMGTILNMVAAKANDAQQSILSFSRDQPERLLREVAKLKMPDHHDVRADDIHLKRLGSILFLAHETHPTHFEDLLLLQGLGPRTLQSLALVSEIIFGKPIRFSDPARFSFAHGGKDGHPFPVPLKIYDETIAFLRKTVSTAKMQRSDRKEAMQALHRISVSLEDSFKEEEERYPEYLQWERSQSSKWGGRTVKDDHKSSSADDQLSLF